MKKKHKKVIIKIIFGVILPFAIHLSLPFLRVYKNVNPFWWKASSIFLVGLPFLFLLEVLGSKFDLKLLSNLLEVFKK